MQKPKQINRTVSRVASKSRMSKARLIYYCFVIAILGVALSVVAYLLSRHLLQEAMRESNALEKAALNHERVFDARLTQVQMSGRFTGKATMAAADPRFVVRLQLEENVAGLGKKGETVAVAIHSPARDLQLSDNEQALGSRFRFHLSSTEDTNRFLLRRDKDTPPEAAPDQSTHPLKNNHPDKKPQPH